jgi:hypothetical protein
MSFLNNEPSSDDQQMLNLIQRREIDQIGEKLRSLDEITTRKFVSLTDFIEQFDWKYSDLDIVDGREIEHLAPEDFWRYVGKSKESLEQAAKI